MNCCCHFGAAIAGEFPEFECAQCLRHGADAAGDYRCRRHSDDDGSAAVHVVNSGEVRWDVDAP